MLVSLRSFVNCANIFYEFSRKNNLLNAIFIGENTGGIKKRDASVYTIVIYFV